MRKFIAFFRRFRVFLVFVILQIIALTSFFSVMSFPRTKFFNTANAVTGTLFSWERNITKYLYLEEANKKLLQENALLQEKLPANYISIDDKTAIIYDTVRKLSYERIPATVINSSYSLSNNYFTINIGHKNGVRKGMGVVSPKGVAGIIYDVSPHFAIVKSILTSNINISAFIHGSNAFGLIKYKKKDPRRVQLTGISNDIIVRKGARVSTRGSAGIFPIGEPIGIVESIQPVEGKALWNITVRLEQDMRKLRYVYVIQNIHQKELQQLEKDYKELQ